MGRDSNVNFGPRSIEPITYDLAEPMIWSSSTKFWRGAEKSPAGEPYVVNNKKNWPVWQSLNKPMVLSAQHQSDLRDKISRSSSLFFRISHRIFLYDSPSGAIASSGLWQSFCWNFSCPFLLHTHLLFGRRNKINSLFEIRSLLKYYTSNVFMTLLPWIEGLENWVSWFRIP